MKSTSLPFIAVVYLLILACLSFHLCSIELPNTNIRNMERYMHCPYHNESGFFCVSDLEKTARILSFQSKPKFDFYNPKVQSLVYNKTILFLGDSLMKNQYISLACLLWEYDNTIHESTIRTTKIGYQPVLKIYSKKLMFELVHVGDYFFFAGHDGEQARNRSYSLKILNASNVTQLTIHPRIEMALQGRIMTHNKRPPDVILLSYGHHFALVNMDTRPFVRAVDRMNEILLSLSQTIIPNTKIVWRSCPARHYERGDWFNNGTCHQIEPCVHQVIQGSNGTSSQYYFAHVVSEALRESALNHHFSFIDISRESMNRCDGHVGGTLGNRGVAMEDCTHYCVPGVPDTWHDGLLHYLS